MMERSGHVFDIVTLTHDTKQNIENNKDSLMPYEPVIAVDTNELMFKDEQGNIVTTKVSVNTIEDLKTFDAPVGTMVFVKGFYSVGDGAHHYRQKVDSTYTGVDAIEGWKIVHNGEVNVSWFGAKGDGVADDTIAFQNALDLSEAKTIKISGDINIKNTLNITRDCVNIIGNGDYFGSIVRFNNANRKTMFSIIGSSTRIYHNLSFKGISFVSDNSADLINFLYISGIVIENCWMYNMANILVGDYSWSNTFRNIKMYNNTGHFILSNNQFNNVIFDSVVIGSKSSTSIDIKNSANITFVACDFEGHTSEQRLTSFSNVQSISFISNYFEQIKGNVITLLNCSAVGIRDNYMFGGANAFFGGGVKNYPVVGTNVDGLEIINNNVLDFGSKCLSFLDNCKNIRIVDNSTKSEHNPLLFLVNDSVTFRGIGEVYNNFVGKKIFYANLPNKGGIVGDICYCTAPFDVSGGKFIPYFIRKKDGEGNVLGVDWAYAGYDVNIYTALDTPYHATQMSKLGILDSYHNYLTDLHEYEKQQNIQSDTGVMNLNVIQPPVIPTEVEEYAKEYNLI